MIYIAAYFIDIHKLKVGMVIIFVIRKRILREELINPHNLGADQDIPDK